MRVSKKLFAKNIIIIINVFSLDQFEFIYRLKYINV